LPKNKNLVQRAKELRKQSTFAEVLFWKFFKIKENLNGWDIDRQVIIGNFIVDFFITELGLIIEIDGSSHNEKLEADSERDFTLLNYDLEIVRYRDSEVKRNLSAIEIDLMNRIMNRIEYLSNKYNNNL